MDPATVAIAATALFFSEALKEGGKGFGKGAAELAKQLVGSIRSRFKQQQVEGVLSRAEQDPGERNRQRVAEELQYQLEQDPGFLAQIQGFVEQLQALQDGQSMATDLETETLEAGSMSQERSGGSGSQEMLSRVKAKNIKIGDMSQRMDG